MACLVAYAFMGWDHGLVEIEAWYRGRHPDWDHARIAECDGAAAGYLAATGGFVDQLFVMPEAQGRGTGRALLAEWLALGRRPATLEVFERNARARTFYEGFGFRPAGRFFNGDDGAWELVYRLG